MGVTEVQATKKVPPVLFPKGLETTDFENLQFKRINQQTFQHQTRACTKKMSAYSFYPGKPSFLAMKYLRTYTPNTQLEPGERYRLRRNMEIQVPGYSEISRDLRCVSEEIEYARYKSPERDLPPPSWLRNSAVGFTSEPLSHKLENSIFILMLNY